MDRHVVDGRRSSLFRNHLVHNDFFIVLFNFQCVKIILIGCSAELVGNSL